MKLVIVSDLHLDVSTAGVSRLEELSQSLHQVLDYAMDDSIGKATGFMFLGDLCDPDLETSAVVRAIQTAIGVAMTLAEAGIPSYWLTGNHDVIEDGKGNHTLTPLKEMHPLVHVIDTPRTFELEGRTVIALPYTSTAWNYSPAKFVESLDAKTIHGPPIVIAHLNIEGMHPGSESTEMPRGRDVFFPYDELEAKFGDREPVYLSGHYHHEGGFLPPRAKRKHTNPIQIIGSLARLTFADEDQTPGFTVVSDGA